MTSHTRPTTLLEVFTYVPERATARRYIWRCRVDELRLWAWRTIDGLPGGPRFISRYERVLVRTEQRMAHAFGWHAPSCGRWPCETWAAESQRALHPYAIAHHPRRAWHRWIVR